MSGYLQDETDPAQGYVEQRVWAAVIAANATNLADTLPVTIPSLDGNIRWEECKWQSRDNFSLPQRGDQCLVVLDEDEALWIIAWWPAVANPQPVTVALTTLIMNGATVSLGPSNSGGTGYRLLRVAN